MMISEVEPDLRQIIRTLRDGNLETAKDRTVELIECTCRMSGPMCREESIRPGPRPELPEYKSAPAKLRMLTKDLARGVVHNAARHAGRCPSNGGTGAERVFGRRTGRGEIEHYVVATGVTMQTV